MLLVVWVQTAHMFGMRDLDVAVALTCWFEPLAGTGAAVAWVMHVQRKDEGAASYNLFMYCCSIIAGVASLFVVVLAVDDARKKKKKKKKKKTKNRALKEEGPAAGENA